MIQVPKIDLYVGGYQTQDLYLVGSIIPNSADSNGESNLEVSKAEERNSPKIKKSINDDQCSIQICIQFGETNNFYTGHIGQIDLGYSEDSF